MCSIPECKVHTERRLPRLRQTVSQTTNNIHVTLKKLLDTFRTRGRSVTFSIQQDSTTTKIRHRPIQRHTSTDKTGEEASTEVGGVGSSPSASGSTFFVGNRPVKVCKKLALSVCEDMRLPQRSMAYGWDEWNGDNKVSGGATRPWACTFFLSTQGKCVTHAHTNTHTHRDTHANYTLVISLHT